MIAAGPGPARDFDALGFAVVPGVVAPSAVDTLARAIDEAGEGPSVLRREGALYGMRDALRGLPEVRGLARSEALLDLVRPVLGPGAFAVRALLFDKTPGANWGVPWHQDLTIAVRERVDAPGFGPRMVTLRVHLDDSGIDQGPLRVLPGSHRDGRLGAEATRLRLERERPVSCLVGRGGVVMIRPLLLHASSPAGSPRRRRVVHLEYAADPLPGGLAWFESHRSLCG